MTTKTTAAAILAVSAAVASGDVILNDGAVTGSYGFEDLSAGHRVTTLDFGAISAEVTHTNGRTNRVFSGRDGHGAVAADGDMFWKLAGGTVEIDFGAAALSEFGFWYSDLEWATLRVTAGSRVVDIQDRNPNTPKRFDISALGGETFSSVTLEFVGHQNDGVGFDGMTVTRASVPAPSAAAALAVTGLVASRRRRR